MFDKLCIVDSFSKIFSTNLQDIDEDSIVVYNRPIVEETMIFLTNSCVLVFCMLSYRQMLA